MSERKYQVLIVGGGLAGALLGRRLRDLKPQLNFLILESAAHWSTAPTWSFHGSDLSPATRAWVPQLSSASWPGYEVRFPGFRRELKESRYYSIRSSEFFPKLNLDSFVKFSAHVTSLSPTGVYLRGGEFITADVVIDARSPQAGQPRAAAGFQKFVGLECELEMEHGLERPILMDATVEQLDGYRFIYVLPWGARSVLVEDTRYSRSPHYSLEDYEREIRIWMDRRGWRIKKVTRVEHAALPIPVYRAEVKLGTCAIGVAAGFVHETTGYSLPMAAVVADRLAKLEMLSQASVVQELQKIHGEFRPQRRFERLLNRMLFGAARPNERREIFARFYRMSETLIANFYAGRLRWRERGRILVGRPPVPVRRALRVVREQQGGPIW